ncbi:5147_t:CDS:1, partial [Dentiscutata erythropus]
MKIQRTSNIQTFLIKFTKQFIFVIIIIIWLFQFTSNVNVRNDDNKISYNESIAAPPLLLNGRERPKQGYVVRFNRLEKSCGNIKNIMIENCLKYLDENEDDYMISFPATAGVSPPPP